MLAYLHVKKLPAADVRKVRKVFALPSEILASTCVPHHKMSAPHHLLSKLIFLRFLHLGPVRRLKQTSEEDSLVGGHGVFHPICFKMFMTDLSCNSFTYRPNKIQSDICLTDWASLKNFNICWAFTKWSIYVSGDYTMTNRSRRCLVIFFGFYWRHIIDGSPQGTLREQNHRNFQRTLWGIVFSAAAVSEQFSTLFNIQLKRPYLKFCHQSHHCWPVTFQTLTNEC